MEDRRMTLSFTTRKRKQCSTDSTPPLRGGRKALRATKRTRVYIERSCTRAVDTDTLCFLKTRTCQRWKRLKVYLTAQRKRGVKECSSLITEARRRKSALKWPFDSGTLILVYYRKTALNALNKRMMQTC